MISGACSTINQRSKETLQGWAEDISHCTSWEELPDNARKYVERTSGPKSPWECWLWGKVEIWNGRCVRRAVRKLYRCSSFVDYGSLRLNQPSSFSANFDRFSLVSSPSHFLGPPAFFFN